MEDVNEGSSIGRGLPLGHDTRLKWLSTFVNKLAVPNKHYTAFRTVKYCR